jgi:methylated-DNA-[protein]-cysteine S-methyltransferase
MSADDPITDTLRRADRSEAQRLDGLRARLASAADASHVLDVAYRTVDTPIGALMLAATEAGLVRVAFAGEDHDRVLAQLAERISPRILRHAPRLDDAARQLDEYFAGARRTFELRLDWQLSTGFRGDVLRHLPEIGYGTTASYATVASLAGRPRAVRAVGSACATNPLPVVVPCHRVVRSDGAMGGYLGGAEAKATLLRLEAAA